MATNGTNGAQTNGASSKTHGYDPNFTESVINSFGPKANPRLATVMGGLVRHLHDWMREHEITLDEFMKGIDMVSSI